MNSESEKSLTKFQEVVCKKTKNTCSRIKWRRDFAFFAYRKTTCVMPSLPKVVESYDLLSQFPHLQSLLTLSRSETCVLQFIQTMKALQNLTTTCYRAVLKSCRSWQNPPPINLTLSQKFTSLSDRMSLYLVCRSWNHAIKSWVVQQRGLSRNHLMPNGLRYRGKYCEFDFFKGNVRCLGDRQILRWDLGFVEIRICDDILWNTEPEQYYIECATGNQNFIVYALERALHVVKKMRTVGRWRKRKHVQATSFQIVHMALTSDGTLYLTDGKDIYIKKLKPSCAASQSNNCDLFMPYPTLGAQGFILGLQCTDSHLYALRSENNHQYILKICHLSRAIEKRWHFEHDISCQWLLSQQYQCVFISVSDLSDILVYDLNHGQKQALISSANFSQIDMWRRCCPFTIGLLDGAFLFLDNRTRTRLYLCEIIVS